MASRRDMPRIATLEGLADTLRENFADAASGAQYGHDGRRRYLAAVAIRAALEVLDETPAPWVRQQRRKAPAVDLAAKKGSQATRRNPRRLKTGA